ncbi:hypothetical protein [Pseudomonas serbica]|jgi:hypothetical protein|uniref:hypothetical protein n=1 Tax=Pseudomonas serbica TaxID=2965074 RepID=UPI00237A098A|nr:hypothetical protein [Pseudomonas serbica]
MSTWKSKLLDKLGVVSVAGTDHGPSGLLKGALLAATVVASLGAAAPAHAEQYNELRDQTQHEGLGKTWAQKQKEAVKEESTFTKIKDSVLNVDSYLVGKAVEQVVDADELKYQQTLVSGESESPYTHVFGAGMSVMAASAAAPAMGLWILAKQVDSSVAFVQEKQEADLNTKMTEVERRTAHVYQETVLASRTEELKKQGIENPTEADFYAQDQRHQEIRQQLIAKNAERVMDAAMADIDIELDQKSTASAAAFDSPDVPSSTSGIGTLLNKDKKVERDHSSELSR